MTYMLLLNCALKLVEEIILREFGKNRVRMAQSVATELWATEFRFKSNYNRKDFCSPKCPDCLWGPSSLLFEWAPDFFPAGKAIVT